MNIETLQIGDNLVYVLIAGSRAVVVDPGMAAPVATFLQAQALTLERILLTHYHADHTGGVAALRSDECDVVGPSDGPVELDHAVEDNAILDFAGTPITVLAIPGHTAHDVAYYLPTAGVLFTGDLLFAGGCGRVFTHDAPQMWASLCRLRGLPDDTRIYGGHDYTLENLEFAAHLEPNNAAVLKRLTRFRNAPESALPSTLGEEKRTNPFLRCDSDAVAAAAGLPRHHAAKVFAAVRAMKDRW